MKYPIGIQTFEELRKGNYVYIDKTDLIFKLVDEGKYYFLSRPRRFGKSLLISTLESYFKGKKELFEGLKISKLEKEWMEYPVFHLDMNQAIFTKENELEDVLNNTISCWEDIYGSRPTETTTTLRFNGVIQRAAEKTGKNVVILIDEYDKPLLQTVNNQDLGDKYRAQLKSFYSCLKTQDKYIKFAFVTGVTKFSKVSIFSDLNNLADLSMLTQYASICGITLQEIENYLDIEVEELATSNELSKTDCYSKLELLYDGYHFSGNSIGVYNPFSLLSTLCNKQFRDYWFETGTPTYLVELMKNANYALEDITKEEVDEDTLNGVDTASMNPIPVIYQSGYLTIKDYDNTFGLYKLGYPNLEVERGFTKFLIPHYLPTTANKGLSTISQFVKAVIAGNAELFMNLLNAFMAGGNYQIAGDAELYFHNAVYIIFKMMGFYVDVEYPTSDGRMDMLVRTSDFIYIIEFKIDKSADEALRQIEAKEYAGQFASDPRKLFKIGVNFSSETRRIEGWKIS